MRRRDQLFAAACAALPPAAALAVATARRFAGDDESDLAPGEAWLLARSVSPDRIARALQSKARRNRAGAVIGIGAASEGREPHKKSKAEVERQGNAQALRSAGVEATPLQRLEALETAASATDWEVAVAGSAALMDALMHAPGAELARSLGLSPRRGQQIRARQRRELEAGQQDLFAEAEL